MKIMLVSFFVSNNIGDLLISSAFAKRMKENDCQIVMYDFLGIQKVEQLNHQIEVKEETIEGSRRRLIIKKILGRYGQYLRYKTNKNWKERFAQFEKDLADCQKVYFAGGNMIMDITPVWPMILEDYIKIISKKGIPFEFLAVGVGPVLYKRSKRTYYSLLSRAAKISVRGECSGEKLKRIGVDNFKVVIDPVLALHLDKAEIRRKRIENFKRNKSAVLGIGVLGEVCFNSRHVYLEYQENVIRMIRNLEADDFIAELILYSTEAMDYDTVKRICTACQSNKIQVYQGKSAEEIIEFYDHLDYIISGRMHSLILAQRCMVPFTSVCWQDKIREFSVHTSGLKRMVFPEELGEIKSDDLKLNEIITLEWMNEASLINAELEKKFDSIFE